MFRWQGDQIMESVRCIASALRQAVGLLKRNDPLILCSSTAFFATFSLSPIIILLMNFFSIYFSAGNIGRQMFVVISSTFGPETARDLQKIVFNFMELESGWLLTVGSSIFFLFVATTLLSVVKNAIHKLWRIRSQPHVRLRQFGSERGTAALIILISGVLLFLSILVDTGLAVSRDYLQVVLPGGAIFAIRLLDILFTLVVVAGWFTIIFKMLPQAVVKWEVAFIGGLITAVLFNLGQFVLARVLVHARLATVFGATTSLALILLFIFYCSFILYFGAAFTYEYGAKTSQPILTGKHSMKYEEKMLDRS